MLLITCASAAITRADENPIPTAAPAERYAAMSQQSPFALATAAPAPVPTGPSFAVNWYVASIARIGDVDFVTIKSRDATVQFALSGKEPNQEQGVVLESIEWADEPLKSTVSLRKGNKLALVRFNEAVIHGSAQQAPASAEVLAAAGKTTAAVQPSRAVAITPPIPNLGIGTNPQPPRLPPLPVGDAVTPQAPPQQVNAGNVNPNQRRIRPVNTLHR